MLDASFPLRAGRQHFDYRAAFWARTIEQLCEKIDNFDLKTVQQRSDKGVVFCFTGQGAQYLGMGKQLYRQFAVFRQAIDEVNQIYRDCCQQDLTDYLWRGSEDRLNDTAVAQPALFAFEYASYKLWLSLGVKPAAVIGHSVGEYVAACVAGIFSLQQAITLVIHRAQLMSSLDADGTMLSVKASKQTLEPWLAQYAGVEFCAHNAEALTVIGGPTHQVAELHLALIEADICVVELMVSHAFHTCAMEPAMKPLADITQKLSVEALQIPMISNLTGQWINDDYNLPDYWAQHLRNPVLFHQGVNTLNAQGYSDFIEMGPRPVLTQFIKAIHPQNRCFTEGVIGREVASIYASATKAYAAGIDINWSVLFAGQKVNKIRIPKYKFNLARYWLDDSENQIELRNINMLENQANMNSQLGMTVDKLTEIFAEILNLQCHQLEPHRSLLHMGVDSFVLVMAIKRIKDSFNIDISIRDIFEKYVSLDKLANHIVGRGCLVPQENSDIIVVAPAVQQAIQQPVQQSAACYQPPVFSFDDDVQESTSSSITPSMGNDSSLTLTQQQYLHHFIDKYCAKTAKSKHQAQQYRQYLCNNRKSSSGFRMEVKELAYSIQCDSSYGATVVDIDGNEYVDLAMGFGATLFGHRPRFIEKALQQQVEKGYQIGPESHLAGECAKMICDATGMDRVLFSNTGTEAVMTAIRIARSAANRSKVVIFTNAYHGHCDSTLCIPDLEAGIGKTRPMSLGTPQSALEDIIVLPFNAANSLEYILAHSDEIAAVITEPVQNRGPGEDTAVFLKQLRKVTEENQIILIFDEILVGFRIALGGAQQWFGVEADMATYGKVIGGGLPIGIVSGKSQIMDKVDGGHWRFDDQSRPDDETTFTAGTFCKHPLAIAACHATMTELLRVGPQLQQTLNHKTDKLVGFLNDIFNAHQVPLEACNFGSFFRIAQSGNLSFMYQPLELDIFFYHLIEKNIYLWEGKTCFLSTAHTSSDIQKVINAVNDSVVEMKTVGFWSDTAPSPDNFNHRDHCVETSSPAAPMVKEGAEVKKYNGSSILNRAMKKIDEPEIDLAAYQPRYPDSIVDESFLATRKPSQTIDFGLYFFGDNAVKKFDQIIEIAEFADRAGLNSLWLPERHFNEFAGFSPNPAIIGAAVAATTKQLQIRASVLSPLRHPVNIAEEWSMLDNISQGRVGIAMASGWFSHDFVLNPQAWGKQRDVMMDHMNAIQHLWKGNELSLPGVEAQNTQVELFPKPMSSGIPMWLTTLGNKQNYIDAGHKGIGVLTNMLGQKVSDLTDNIKLYKAARKEAGFDPEGGYITVLLHTLICDDQYQAIEMARKPFCQYLASSVGLFQKMVEQQNLEADFDNLAEEDRAFLLNAAYERYVQGNALIGDADSCIKVVEQLKSIGVSEVACFVDFGVTPEQLQRSLPNIVKLSQHFTNPQDVPKYTSLAPIICGESGLQQTTVNRDNTQVATNSAVKLALTDDQKMLWFIAKTNLAGMMAFCQSSVLKLIGELDVDALQQAYDIVVKRHDALRTLVDPDGQYQTVLGNIEVKIGQIDFSNLDASCQDTQLKILLNAQTTTAFSFEQVLHRLTLVKLSAQSHTFILTTHHLVCDGVSIGVILTELAAYYDSLCTGDTLELPKTLQFSEFVGWRHSQYLEMDYEREEAFWLAKTASHHDQMLNLPLDFSRPAVKTYNGDRHVIMLDSAFFTRLKVFAKYNHVTYFMIVLGAFYCLLYRLARQQQVIIGVPFSGRVINDSDNMVGYLSNVYPIMIELQNAESVSDFINRLRGVLLDAYEHQNYPFSSLIEKGQPRRDASQSPFFNVAFNWDRVDIPSMSGLQTSGYNLKPNYVEYDLMVNVLEVNDEIELSWDFNTDLFEPSTIHHIAEQFNLLLTGFMEQPQSYYSKILLEQQPKQLAQSVDASGLDSPVFVEQLLSQCAINYPEKSAVTSHDRTLNYKELNLLVTKLANRLVKKGVNKGDCVAVCLEPSLALLVSIHAVIKIGATYIPLNTRYPALKLQQITQNCDSKVIIRDKTRFEATFAQGDSRVLNLDDTFSSIRNSAKTVLDTDINGKDIAYLIHTSGTTGQPKGVRTSHNNLLSFCHSALARLKINGSERFLNVSPASFDMSIPDFFLPLFNGGHVVIANEEERLIPARIIGLLEKYDIDFMQATPTTWNAMVEQGWQGKANMLACAGGEMAPSSLLKKMKQNGMAVYCCYGPTETTVWSNVLKVEELHLLASSVPVGLPLQNSTVYILDQYLQPVPYGHSGEIYIGGEGVADGYANQPALTQTCFIANPWGSGNLYKTGDLGRWNDTAGVVILGRLDSQIKVRGFRIEIGEIEAALTAHENVVQAAVVTQEVVKGQVELVGFIELTKDSELTGQDIRQQIKIQLPDYMVPRVIKVMDALPRSGNDKLDRLQLPLIDIQQEIAGYVAPHSDIEKQLCHILQHQLGLEKVCVEADFFELGGTSLDLARLQLSIKGQFGKQLSVTKLFRHTSARAMAKLVSDEGELVEMSEKIDGLTVEIQGQQILPLTPAFNYHINHLGYGHHLNLVKLFDLVNKQVDESVLKQAVKCLVDKNPVLTMSIAYNIDEQYEQHIGDVEPILQVVDYSDLPAQQLTKQIETQLSDLQGSFKLERGQSLAKFVLFKTGQDSDDKLWIMVHFALIDAYGLELLVGQLCHTLCALLANQTPIITTGTSYVDWFNAYSYYANNQAKEELVYWMNLPWHRAAILKLVAKEPQSPLGRFYHNEDYLEMMHVLSGQQDCSAERLYQLGASQTIHYFSLDEHDTEQLKSLMTARKVELVDALLATFYAALSPYLTDGFLPIDFMFSNRKPVFSGVNVSDTVMRAAENIVLPLVVSAQGIVERAKEISDIREQLPGSGLALPAMRDLCHDPLVSETIGALPQPRVGFNYLSLWSQEHTDFNQFFSNAEACFGTSMGNSIERERGVWVQLYVDESPKCLEFALTYDAHRLSHEQVVSMSKDFLAQLQELVCTNAGSKSLL